MHSIISISVCLNDHINKQYVRKLFGYVLLLFALLSIFIEAKRMRGIFLCVSCSFSLLFSISKKSDKQKIWLRIKFISESNCAINLLNARESFRRKTTNKSVRPQLKFVTINEAWLINRIVMHLWHIYELPRAFRAYFHLLFILIVFFSTFFFFVSLLLQNNNSQQLLCTICWHLFSAVSIQFFFGVFHPCANWN